MTRTAARMASSTGPTPMRLVGADTAVAPGLHDVFSRIWAVYEAGDFLPTCAWCGRVRIDDRWLVPSRAALAAIDERNVLSHSICDECAQACSLTTALQRVGTPATAPLAAIRATT